MNSNLYRWIVIVILIAIVLFSLQRLGVSTTWLPDIAQKVFWTVISPFQSALDFVYEGVTGTIESWRQWNNLREENRRLQVQVFELERKLKNKERIFNENLRLRKLLAFVEKQPSFTYLGARVIGKAPGNWFSRLIINRGESDGLKSGMPVITYDGALVGEIGEVFPHSAQVITVFDPVFVVGGVVQRPDSRTIGIVKSGENSLIEPRLVMESIPWDGDIKKEDVIVTSGLAKGFPKGLPIGRVLEVKQKDYGLTQSATIEAFMAGKTIEEVLIIVSF